VNLTKRRLLNMIALLATAVSVTLLFQTTSQAQVQGDAFTYLPDSDGVLVVDVRRLMNETLPRVLAGNANAMAHVNADLENFKTRTGVDPRAFDRAVVGARYTRPSPNVTRMETVAIAQGRFDVQSLAAAGREAAKGNMREEKFRGATIMIFTINDQMKMFGLFNMKVRDLAVCALNKDTLAIGSPENVRAAIVAGHTRRLRNVELKALATRDPQAVIGFASKMSRDLMGNLNLGTDAIAEDVSSIRLLYGAIGSTDTDVSLAVIARTETPSTAKNLGETVTGLKQLAGFLILRLKDDQRALAESAISNLKITTRGNELEVRTQFAAASLAAMIK
jgi:hypothetical protein